MEKKRDYGRFCTLMEAMQQSIGGEMSEKRAKTYFEFLSDIGILDLEKACYKLIQTERYPVFPTIGKIRSLIEGDAEDQLDLATQTAWAKAEKLVWNLGDSGEPSGDELLDEAIRIAFGGWLKFGMTDPERESVDRSHFMRCYKSLARTRGLALTSPEVKKLDE